MQKLNNEIEFNKPYTKKRWRFLPQKQDLKFEAGLVGLAIFIILVAFIAVLGWFEAIFLFRK